MDQNQSVDSTDSDLQQAIDNINNTTAPDAFSEPVAAPSSIPEGDNGELGDPVGPFPMPDTGSQVGVVTPGPEPMAPLDPISLPDLSVSGENPADATVITKSDSMNPSQADPNQPMDPALSQNQNSTAEASQPSEPTSDQPTATEHHDTPTVNPGHLGDDQNHDASANPDALKIKEAALRDLVPLLGHVNVDPAQKFKICRDIFEDLHDYSVLDQAYNAASEIQDEEQRADSLLYLIESIDAMH